VKASHTLRNLTGTKTANLTKSSQRKQAVTPQLQPTPTTAHSEYPPNSSTVLSVSIHSTSCQKDVHSFLQGAEEQDSQNHEEEPLGPCSSSMLPPVHNL